MSAGNSFDNPLADDLDGILDRTRPLWEDLRGNRIFITGGTGFFGCWFLESFLWANRNLELKASATVLTRDPQAFRATHPHLALNSSITLVHGDVQNFQSPAGSFSHVIHAATEASAALNESNPTLMLETNRQGTARCIEFAVEKGARRFLLTSSGAVYGKQPWNLEKIPESYQGAPDVLSKASAYAEGKRLAELQCALAYQSGKFEPVIARCFAFVGPYMKLDRHFAIGNFLRDQIEGKPIVISGDGTPYRSYLYAADLMTWLWTALFRGEPCRAYNVGSEKAINIRDLAQMIAEDGEPRVKVQVNGAPSDGPPQRYVPDTARIRRELGLEHYTSLPDAIERTREWNLQLRGIHA